MKEAGHKRVHIVEAGNGQTGKRELFGGWKYFKIGLWSLLHNCINLLKLALWILQYINCTLIKLFKKWLRRNSDFTFKTVELSEYAIISLTHEETNFRSFSLQNSQKVSTLPSNLTCATETKSDRYCTNIHIKNVQNFYETC